MKNLTHYRKVYKTDHLSIHDLEEMIEEGKSLLFTIKEVKQEVNVKVAGKSGDFNIAYFEEDIKPMVINPKNGKTLRSLAPQNSPMVEHWSGLKIELYIDSTVMLKGERVGGIRIKKPAGIPDKKPLDESRFLGALESIKRGEYSKVSLLSKFLLTIEQINQVNEL